MTTASLASESERSIIMLFYSVTRNIQCKIVSTVQFIAYLAVTRARLVICLVPTLSILCFAIGISTNFYMETNPMKLYTPSESKLLRHGRWLGQHFPVEKASIHIIIHGEGRNILGKSSIDYAFFVVNEVRTIEGFNATQCSISGVVNFFNDDYGLFRETIRNDDDAIRAVSVLPYLPNGNIVNRKDIFGYPSEDDEGILQSVKSFSVRTFHIVKNICLLQPISQ